MLCRAAESVFWMSRYVERAENVARFIGVNLELSLGGQGGITAQWEPLIYASGDEELFREHYNDSSAENVLHFLIFDRRNPNSILTSLAMARENARVVRDTVSVGFWHRMNRFYIGVRDATKDRAEVLRSPQEFLDQVIESSQTLIGIEQSTNSHGEAWNFSRLGRLLERADKTSRILDVKYFILLPNVEAVGRSLDVVQWSALLESTSALAMYRRTHGRLRPPTIVQFLAQDREFPRSMLFCISEALQALQSLTDERSPESQWQIVRVLAGLVESLDNAPIETIIAEGLHEFIDRFQTRVSQVADGIALAWFQRDETEQAAIQHQQ